MNGIRVSLATSWNGKMTSQVPYHHAHHLEVDLEREAKAVYNLSAKEYLSMVDKYAKTIQIQHFPLRTSFEGESLPIDKSIGIGWVILVPLIYFLSVILLVGLILGYYWLMDSAKETFERSQISLPLHSRRAGGWGQGQGCSGGGSLHTLQSVENTLHSVASASSNLSSWFSFLGAHDESDTKPELGCQFSFGANDGAANCEMYRGDKTSHSHRSGAKQADESIPAVASASSTVVSRRGDRTWRSLRGHSMTSLRRVLTTCNSSMSPESVDNKSRDSLRMSTEYHKLVWTSDSGGSIPPDRLYGTDDEEIAAPKTAPSVTLTSKSTSTSPQMIAILAEKSNTGTSNVIQIVPNKRHSSTTTPKAKRKLLTSSRGVHTSATKSKFLPASTAPGEAASSYSLNVYGSHPQKRSDNRDRWSSATPSISDLAEFPFMEDNMHVYVNPIFTVEGASMDDLRERSSCDVRQEEFQEGGGNFHLNTFDEEEWSQANDITGSESFIAMYNNMTSPCPEADESSFLSTSDNTAVGDSISGENEDKLDIPNADDLWPDEVVSIGSHDSPNHHQRSPSSKIFHEDWTSVQSEKDFKAFPQADISVASW